MKKTSKLKAVKIGYVFEYKLPPKEKMPQGCDFYCNIHNHTEYCLSGSTIIYNCLLSTEYKTGRIIRTDHTNFSTCRTIKHLYDHTRKLNSPTWWYNVKVWDGTKFVASKIKQVYKNKSKKLYLITTETGKSIKASKMHKFLTEDGWKRLYEIRIGNKLACNGFYLYDDMEWLRKKYFDENLTQEQIAKECKVNSCTIASRIKEFGLCKTKSQWMKGHKVTDETKNKILKIKKIKRIILMNTKPETISQARYRSKYFVKEKCERCEKHKSEYKLLVHHKNSDIFDNDKNNLETLCKSCHELEHSGCPQTIRYEKIISIEYVGKEITYDLEVEHKAHNFVANGIVTHNSILDGMQRIERGVLSLDLDTLYEDQVTLVRRAETLKQPGVGLTDHGTLSGFFRFHTECVEHNINPIIGIEFYVIDSLKNLKNKDKGNHSHLTALARNYNGLLNLFQINKIAWTEGFYYRPKIDYEILKKYSSDIIMLSGCSGDSPYLKIINSDLSEKEKNIKINDLTKLLLDIYGKNLYMEIMPHRNYEQAIALNSCVINQALKYDIDIVATGDSHYSVKEHS